MNKIFFILCGVLSNRLKTKPKKIMNRASNTSVSVSPITHMSPCASPRESGESGESNHCRAVQMQHDPTFQWAVFIYHQPAYYQPARYTCVIGLFGGLLMNDAMFVELDRFEIRESPLSTTNQTKHFESIHKIAVEIALKAVRHIAGPAKKQILVASNTCMHRVVIKLRLFVSLRPSAYVSDMVNERLKNSGIEGGISAVQENIDAVFSRANRFREAMTITGEVLADMHCMFKSMSQDVSSKCKETPHAVKPRAIADKPRLITLDLDRKKKELDRKKKELEKEEKELEKEEKELTGAVSEWKNGIMSEWNAANAATNRSKDANKSKDAIKTKDAKTPIRRSSRLAAKTRAPVI